MCSHLLADVQDVCDRIAILYGGELKVLGRVQGSAAIQDETQLRTSTLSDAAFAEVKAALKKHKIELKDVTHPTATLEELFLQDGQGKPGTSGASSRGRTGRRGEEVTLCPPSPGPGEGTFIRPRSFASFILRGCRHGF